MSGGVYAVLAATRLRVTRKNANANAKANYTAKHTPRTLKKMKSIKSVTRHEGFN